MKDEIRNVFISHVHEDDAGLAKLKSLLGKKGLVIRDSSINSSNPNNAKNPDYIKSSILAPQINWAGTLLVYVSASTKDSEWVNWEIEYAAKQDKRIVGVFVRGAQDSDVPKNLELYADAVVGWSGPSVTDAIAGKISDWTTAAGMVRPLRRLPRYKC